MKKLLLAAAVALSYGTAYAGMYHTGPTNICADCHTMHASMAHDFAGTTPTSTAPKAFAAGSWLPNQDAPLTRLLKGASETALCEACHNGLDWAPDVVGANTTPAGAALNVRSAGFIPEAGSEHTGHQMEFAGTAPGDTRSFTDFTCVSCHSPHGKTASFRNLNPYSLGISSANYPTFYQSATPFSASGDVRINSNYVVGNTYGQNIAYYSNANVYYENGAANKLDDYCGKCHGNFHNSNGAATRGPGTTGGTAYDTTLNSNQSSTAIGGTNHFIRHPTGDIIGRQPTDGTYTTKVYAISGAGGTGVNAVGCLSCHKAHGTANPFNLFYSTAATAAGPNALDDTESGAGGQYGGLCSNCHSQAR